VALRGASWSATDWPQIRAFHSLLFEIDHSPAVALSRAIMRRYAGGPPAAMVDLTGLSDQWRYHLFHATRAGIAV